MAPTPSPEPGTSRTRVVIEAEALDDLVNRLRPLALTALLHVALGATLDDRGVLVATTSSRALARTFGVDKDTGAAVLKTLVRRGHLRRLVQPRSGGRFAPARYVVRLPDGVAVTPVPGGGSTPPCPPSTATAAPATRRARAAPASVPPRHDGTRDRTATGAGPQLDLFTPTSTPTGERTAR